MGRLIDADDLNEKILDVKFMGLGWFKANKAVNDMPTAYDVETVVKQIEDASVELYGFAKVVGLDKVIDIVRKGGVKNA